MKFIKFYENKKEKVDDSVQNSEDIVGNSSYFSKLVLQKTVNSLMRLGWQSLLMRQKWFRVKLTREYINEYNNVTVRNIEFKKKQKILLIV